MTHVDFISATFDVHFGDFHEMFVAGKFSLFPDFLPFDLRPYATYNVVTDGDYVKRQPYRNGAHSRDGWSIFWGGHDNFLIEVSGRGCAALGLSGIANMLQRWHDLRGAVTLNKVTRVDIAQDMQSDLSPFEVVSERGINERIKTRNVSNSKTGQTFYIGSRKSARFCRVYKYNEPHPRAGYIRTEFQFNKDTAGGVAEHIRLGTASPRMLFNGAYNKTFINAHANEDVVDIPIVSDRKNSGTVNWILTQCVPAMARVIDEGEMSLLDLIQAIEERRGRPKA